jgi:hypothetical protein
MPNNEDIDLKCINTIRTLAMDAVQAANSGHPGTPMALAPVVNVPTGSVGQLPMQRLLSSAAGRAQVLQRREKVIVTPFAPRRKLKPSQASPLNPCLASQNSNFVPSAHRLLYPLATMHLTMH